MTGATVLSLAAVFTVAPTVLGLGNQVVAAPAQGQGAITSYAGSTRSLARYRPTSEIGPDDAGIARALIFAEAMARGQVAHDDASKAQEPVNRVEAAQRAMLSFTDEGDIN